MDPASDYSGLSGGLTLCLYPEALPLKGLNVSRLCTCYSVMSDPVKQFGLRKGNPFLPEQGFESWVRNCSLGAFGPFSCSWCAYLFLQSAKIKWQFWMWLYPFFFKKKKSFVGLKNKVDFYSHILTFQCFKKAYMIPDFIVAILLCWMAIGLIWMK